MEFAGGAKRWIWPDASGKTGQPGEVCPGGISDVVYGSECRRMGGGEARNGRSSSGRKRVRRKTSPAGREAQARQRAASIVERRYRKNSATRRYCSSTAPIRCMRRRQRGR